MNNENTLHVLFQSHMSGKFWTLLKAALSAIVPLLELWSFHLVHLVAFHKMREATYWLNLQTKQKNKLIIGSSLLEGCS